MRSRSGVVRKQRRISQHRERVFRRGARHGDGALRQRLEPVALEVVCRNHRLSAADQDAQAKIVTLGALRLFHGAVTHVYRQRHRTHGECVGLIGAGAPRGRDEALGEISNGGLIEKR